MTLTGTDRKPWVTAQARATLAGFTATLSTTDDGRPSLIVSRWALCREFTDPAEVEVWLQRVEGKERAA